MNSNGISSVLAVDSLLNVNFHPQPTQRELHSFSFLQWKPYVQYEREGTTSFTNAIYQLLSIG